MRYEYTVQIAQVEVDEERQPYGYPGQTRATTRMLETVLTEDEFKELRLALITIWQHKDNQ